MGKYFFCVYKNEHFDTVKYSYRSDIINFSETFIFREKFLHQKGILICRELKEKERRHFLSKREEDLYKTAKLYNNWYLCKYNKHLPKEKMREYICPSMLACDFTCYGEEATRMMLAGADRLHMDIMDGNFVPNISFGPPLLSSLRKVYPNVYLDCHLMVSEPEKWVEPFAKILKNDSGFTFHLEATKDPCALINKIKENNMNVGIAINPSTHISELISVLKVPGVIEKIDIALIMTVEPGFGGQKFMSHMLPKIRALRELFPYLNIQVDGGISEKNIKLVVDAGANNIVAGSSIFKSDDAEKTIKHFRSFFPNSRNNINMSSHHQ